MGGERPVPPWVASAAAGVLAGLLAGFFGVGGGIVLVPLAIWLLRLGQHEAHATSLAAIFVIALAGTARFAVAGSVDWVIGIALGAGGLLGSTYGAGLMHRLSPRALRGVFAVVLVVAGVRMVVG